MDLLLDLIQKAQLDINKLALAKVTDQFLAYVEANQQKDPEYISEFLVMACKLIQIKSESMLPRPPARSEEEDAGEDLARQLLIYREIKKATTWLNNRSENNLLSFLHVAQSFPVTSHFDLTGIEVDDLLSALFGIIIRNEVVPEGSSISIPKLTLRKKVQDVMSLLVHQRQIQFSALLTEESSKLDAIVAFLAVLELVKQHYVETSQESVFGEIAIKALDSLLEINQVELSIED